MGKGIVLGRFQPFHKGHAHLVEHALANFEQITIAVGSAQEEWTVENPFSIQERTDMIEAWAMHNEFQDKITIVGIEDINDPPNWVDHARQHHGEGMLVTSDATTSTLYEEANFPVHNVELNERERLEGWRVRQTAKMLSTVYDDDAVVEVLCASVPKEVVDWLITNDALFRLSTFETGVHAG